MPVLLDSDEDLERWLTCDPAHGISSVADLLRPYPGKLEVYPVPSLVNKVGNDSPDCIARLAAPAEVADASPSPKRRRGASGSPELAATRKITAFFSPTGKPAKPAKPEPVAPPAKPEPAACPTKPKRVRRPSPSPQAAATQAQEDDAAATEPQPAADGPDADDPDPRDADADALPDPFADNPEWQHKREALGTRPWPATPVASFPTLPYHLAPPLRMACTVGGRGAGLLGQRGSRGVAGV